jgi:hypothetical protein
MGPTHIRAADYQLLYTPRELRSLFKFTFVRNPWSRLASAFYFLKSGGINEFDEAFAAKQLAKYEEFEHFVLDWVNPDNVYQYYHFQPQWHYAHVNGRQFPFDFIGQFEELGRDFAFVCSRLCVKRDLRWTNRTRVAIRDYATLYTPEMAQRVAEVYSDDIRAFGFSFPEPSAQTLCA